MLRPPFHQTRPDGTAFRLRRPGNLLLVKREGVAGWLVCATTDNLTTARQTAFIGYLCAEGFISTAFEPMNDFTAWKEAPVRWIVDPSWPEIDPVYARHLRCIRWCLVGTMAAWVAVIIALLYC